MLILRYLTGANPLELQHANFRGFVDSRDYARHAFGGCWQLRASGAWEIYEKMMLE